MPAAANAAGIRICALRFCLEIVPNATMLFAISPEADHERLNALINVVESQISNGRNGKQ